MTEISPKQAVKYVRNLSDQPDYDFIYKNSSDNSQLIQVNKAINPLSLLAGWGLF